MELECRETNLSSSRILMGNSISYDDTRNTK